MSKYKVLSTEFKNSDSLKKALAEIGFTVPIGTDLKKNESKLATSWSGPWGGQAQNCAIAIGRAEAQRLGLGSMDGVGFVWNGVGYDLIQDKHDMEYDGITRKMNLLKQKYASHEIRRQAFVKGYSVQEKAEADGSIRMTLIRR